MNKFLLFICILLVGTGSFAQTQLVLTNVKLNKMILVKPGNTMVVLYKGYLGQTEMIKNMVTDISDSTITIVVPASSLSFWNNRDEPTSKTIKISDIAGFRKISLGRLMLKNMLTLGAVIGSYAILNNIDKGKAGNLGRDMVISLGVGIGTKMLVDALLPENIKYLMTEGWQTTVIHQ